MRLLAFDSNNQFVLSRPQITPGFQNMLDSLMIVLHPADNVAVARTDIPQGSRSDIRDLTALTQIDSGHKIALGQIPAGSNVLKYGQIIGIALQDIQPGEHVHLQNLGMPDNVAHQSSCHAGPVDAVTVPTGTNSFMGYDRGNGQVGTRNFIGIITTVNCSATVSRYVADHYNRNSGLKEFDNVDGVVALTHGGGCAINTDTEGYLYLTRVIAGYARHPNFGGVLMIGLGCETNQISHILDAYGLRNEPRLRTMTIQKLGGTRRTIDAAIAAIDDMLGEVNAVRRTPQPLSALTVALECGGSDGYSGISANPALGVASDLIVAHGGTTCLAETPEIYGAEHLLTRRAVSAEVATKLLDRIDWWRNYTARNGAELNNNPSFGNKEGGLTTILEKSLGAVAKGGAAPLSAVYEYAEMIDSKGFVFMDTPGYDPVAVTGQVAGGCNIVCFTTGRGSVSGFKPAPCIKIATNDVTFHHMEEDMDINCGGVVSGTDTIAAAGQRIFEMIVEVASGGKTKSEIYDYGDNEFVPWQIGAVT
jgi:galactarate dehydratase